MPFLRIGSITGIEEQKVITGLLDLLLQIMPHPAYQVCPTELTRITKMPAFRTCDDGVTNRLFTSVET